MNNNLQTFLDIYKDDTFQKYMKQQLSLDPTIKIYINECDRSIFTSKYLLQYLNIKMYTSIDMTDKLNSLDNDVLKLQINKNMTSFVYILCIFILSNIATYIVNPNNLKPIIIHWIDTYNTTSNHKLQINSLVLDNIFSVNKPTTFCLLLLKFIQNKTIIFNTKDEIINNINKDKHTNTIYNVLLTNMNLYTTQELYSLKNIDNLLINTNNTNQKKSYEIKKQYHQEAAKEIIITQHEYKNGKNDDDRITYFSICIESQTGAKGAVDIDCDTKIKSLNDINYKAHVTIKQTNSEDIKFK